MPTFPFSSRPQIALIGAGAIGSYYGARLVQGGNDVHFLLRGDYTAVKSNGLKIASCAGDFSLPSERLNLYQESRAMPPVDYVIVTLKTTSNDQFAPLIAPLLKPDTAILTLQNGLGNEEQLAGLFGHERVLGGMAFTCINRLSPGVIDHSAHGLIRLGELGGGSSPRARAIAAMFNSSGVPCEVLHDLRYGRWEKLVWNIPFNGLSTVLDQTTDLILSTPQGEQLVRDIMAEVIASARACGAELPASLIETNISRTREMAAYRTSMQVDRNLGRDLEIEAILGEPARSGAASGVLNPLMQTLYRLTAMIRAQWIQNAR